MQALKRIVIGGGLVVAACANICAMPADDIATMDNREYYPKLHRLLSNAKSSIRVIMFSATHYPDPAGSLTNRLIDDLIAAVKRGVEVEVILERGGKDRDASLNKKNDRVKSILEKEGISVYNDSLKVTTHSKLIIVDERITVIGSTNWSYSALAANNETAAAIDSKEVAAHYVKYFEALKRQPGESANRLSP
jgi:cardiolipin synthase